MSHVYDATESCDMSWASHACDLTIGHSTMPHECIVDGVTCSQFRATGPQREGSKFIPGEFRDYEGEAVWTDWRGVMAFATSNLTKAFDEQSEENQK